MINFIKWGLSHENGLVRQFFVTSVALTILGWTLGVMVALISMNLEVTAVLLLPVIYAFIELYKLYRQERDECDK